MQIISAHFFAFFGLFLSQINLFRKNLKKLLILKFLTNKARYLAGLLIFTVYFVNPSAVAADFLKVIAPAEIFLETQFEINLEISTVPNTSYFVKARISNDQSKWTSGQTLDEAKNIWLSDTISWSSFPSFTTDNNGYWSGKIYARASKNANLGANFLMIRIHTGSSTNIDSAIYNLVLKEIPKAEVQSTQNSPLVGNLGEPVLNEFLPQPNSGGKEWVEIKNKGTSSADISGWKIDDEPGKSSPYVLPNGSIIAPGGFLVVTFDSPKLNDLADSVRLLKSDDSVVESYTYKDSVKGQAFAKDQFGSWFVTTNTSPNAQNPIPPKTVTNSSSVDKINTTNKPNADNVETIAQNKLPSVLGSNDKKIATVSASFAKRDSNKFTSLPLIIFGGLLLLVSAGILLKRRLKSGHPEKSEQPL